MRWNRVWLGIGAVLVLLGAACTTDEDTDAAASEQSVPDDVQPAAAEDDGRAVDLVGTLEVEPAKAAIGDEISVRGSELPPSTELDLVWTTPECQWVLEGEQNEEYHGRSCADSEVPLETVTTDAQGDVETSFVVPDGYGFAHDVLLVDGDGAIRNKALVDVAMDVSVSPTSGPVGTPITIEVTGMGAGTLENQRTILYDNAYTGFLSSVTTEGTATAVIPATGAVGTHVIEIERGAYTFPYLNPAQSPRPDIPTFDATFEVTAGDPVLPPPIEDQNPGVVPSDEAVPTGDGPGLAADVAAAPVETEVTLTGAGFSSGADVTLNWYRIVGNRVGGQGWEERSLELGSVTVDGDGGFEHTFAIPHDVGGPHRIEALVDGEALAETSVRVTPAASVLSPGSGPVGSEFEIQLTGVGWTETANIYTTVYDNGYVGYECGFNSQGDVTVPLHATGQPGWHFIDLYPAIYKGEEARGVNSFRIPQLTYELDHPGEDLPAFRFAFQIT